MIYTKLVESLEDGELEVLSTAIHTERMKRAAVSANSLPPLNEAEVSSVSKNCRIDAIRAYRNRVGCSLLQAKAVVDEHLMP